MLFMKSIGGALGIHLAATNRDLIKGVILENTFTNLRAVIPYVMPLLKPFSLLCSETWESDKAIPRINSETPMLFLSGRKDEIVPSVAYAIDSSALT